MPQLQRRTKLLGAMAVVAALTIGLTAASVGPAQAAVSSIAVKRNDYNRDGNSDLLITAANDCLYRRNGNGSGGFGGLSLVQCGFGDYWSTEGVGDINRDGVGDLVAIHGPTGVLHRWYGNGSGGFTHAGTWGGGWSSYRCFAGMGDLNRDGVGDLVAVRGSNYPFHLWRWSGNGGGGFNAGTDLGDLILSSFPNFCS